MLNQVTGLSLEAELTRELETLRRGGLLRSLRRVSGRPGPRMVVDGRDVLMLAGANYLDLAGDRRVVRASMEASEAHGSAAGGARLISGNLCLHEDLEQDLADFVGTEASLLFSTGYMANLGAVTALAGPDDVIVSDSLNHASIIDACRLSRAETRIYRHNDVESFRDVARSLSGYRRRILVVDGVFSMDGDLAALHEFVPLARRYEMAVVVDDAHGVGILGEHGRGTTEHFGVDCDLLIGNLGKALGSFGAFVACSHTVREYLINRSRSFVFTCGLPASAVAGARAALSIVKSEPWRRRSLLERADQLRGGLQSAGYDTGASSTHVVPAIVGKNDLATDLCERALRRGVFAQAIRFPSVPDLTARLRLTPMASHSPAEIQTATDLFGELRDNFCRAGRMTN